ncbi:hypothetical protein BH23GEM8_BH23GEM8_09220 [soil metagenome]
MRNALRLFLPLVLLAVVPTMPAVAQEGMVPMELVQHLVPGFSPGESGMPEVHVGIVPEAVASALALPPGARVLGSVIYPRSSRTVVAFPSPATAAIAAMELRLLSSGWTRLTVERQSGFAGGGMGNSAVFCRGDAERIQIAPGRLAGPDRVMTVLHSTDARFSPCEGRTGTLGSRTSNPIPSLTPPPGARVEGGGSGSGGDRADARATIWTEESASDLVAHYAAQLVEHGWRAGAESSAADHAVRTWTLSDEAGEEWHGILLATTASGDPERRELLLRLIRTERR